MTTHLPSPLDDAARDEVAARLQPVLVDLVDLSVTAKQLHWTVVGPSFTALHTQLDAVTDAARTWSDQVAERLAAVGVAPDGRLARVAADTDATPVRDGWVAERAVVDDLVERLGAAIGRLRVHLEGVGKHDPVSEDVLLGVLAGLEEQHWMFAAQRVQG